MSFNDVSKTFCVLPWIHLATEADGRAKVCCLSNKFIQKVDGEKFSFEKHSIKEIWNSEDMQRVREKMLAGEKLPECSKCYEEESYGPHSMRSTFNSKWFKQEKEEIQARISNSQANAFKLEKMPFYYDLRQGNLCNLKCRSCAPENSISIEKEYSKIASQDQWFKSNFYSYTLRESYRNWFNNTEFNEQLVAQIPGIKKMYFTGGEPTLIEKNFEFMQVCVDQGHASNIELMFNTNMTNITDRFINLIKNFKYVMLNLSIDGLGAEQEYLRSNTHWPAIERNLKKLAENASPNTQLMINPVVQASNVLTIHNLFEYVENLNRELKVDLFHFMPIILLEPKHLDLFILPVSIRQKAKERLEAYYKKSRLVQVDDFFRIRLEQLLARLSDPSQLPAKHVEKFITFTATLDKARNEKFCDTFPELFNDWILAAPEFDWSPLVESK